MDIDFSLVLVCLVALCGGLWLLDSLLITKIRLAAIEKYKHTHENLESRSGCGARLGTKSFFGTCSKNNVTFLWPLFGVI